MVRAWYMDSSDADQRLPHMKDPEEFVSLDQLKEFGVLYWKIDADRYEEEGVLEKIRTERGITYKDEITCSREKLPNYDEKLKMFFKEHLHSDEEIRFVLDGSGYFDVRDPNDKWVRVEVEKGDLLLIPAGIYHRFTLDSKNYIQAMRLFVGEPVWTPINRPADDHPVRVNYLKTVKTTVPVA